MLQQESIDFSQAPRFGVKDVWEKLQVFEKTSQAVLLVALIGVEEQEHYRTLKTKVDELGGQLQILEQGRAGIKAGVRLQ